MARRPPTADTLSEVEGSFVLRFSFAACVPADCRQPL